MYKDVSYARELAAKEIPRIRSDSLLRGLKQGVTYVSWKHVRNVNLQFLSNFEKRHRESHKSFCQKVVQKP